MQPRDHTLTLNFNTIWIPEVSPMLFFFHLDLIFLTYSSLWWGLAAKQNPIFWGSLCVQQPPTCPQWSPSPGSHPCAVPSPTEPRARGEDRLAHRRQWFPSWEPAGSLLGTYPGGGKRSWCRRVCGEAHVAKNSTASEEHPVKSTMACHKSWAWNWKKVLQTRLRLQLTAAPATSFTVVSWETQNWNHSASVLLDSWLSVTVR